MMRTQKGFTLIEILIALAIVSTILVSLALSFQVGLSAQKQNEMLLSEQRERDIFLNQLARELRNAFPYAKQPFVGKSKVFQFPTRIIQYTEKGTEDNPYQVTYEFKLGKIYRKVQGMQKFSLKKNRASEEELFKDLTDVHFEYLHSAESETLNWQENWQGTETMKLPRAIRIYASGGVFGHEPYIKEILIPQGSIMKG